MDHGTYKSTVQSWNTRCRNKLGPTQSPAEANFQLKLQSDHIFKKNYEKSRTVSPKVADPFPLTHCGVHGYVPMYFSAHIPLCPYVIVPTYHWTSIENLMWKHFIVPT